MLARGMAQAFEGYPDEAREMLDDLNDNISTAIEGTYRMRYLIANAAVTALVVVLLTGLLSLLGSGAIPVGEKNWFPFTADVVERYAKLGILGAVGAFLSVSMGIKQIKIDVELRVSEHVWTGGSRIVIGVIGAMVIGLTLDSKFLSPSFGNEVSAPVHYLLAFIAGFSETFVPNTLRRVRSKTGGRRRSQENGHRNKRAGAITRQRLRRRGTGLRHQHCPAALCLACKKKNRWGDRPTGCTPPP